MKRTLCLTGTIMALLIAGCGEEEKVPSQGDSQPGPAEAVPTPSTSTVSPTNPPLEGAPPPGASVAVDTVESLAQEFVEQLDALAEALKAVEDVPTATEVGETATRAAGQCRSIASRLQALPVPAAEVRGRISAEIETRQQEIGRSLGGQEDFLNKLPAEARPIVKDAMGTFILSMNEVAPVLDEYFGEPVQESEPTPSPPVNDGVTPVPEPAPGE